MYIVKYIRSRWLRRSSTAGLALLLLICAMPVAARTVVDATGRGVEIPDRIERIMPAGAQAAVLLYTLAPGKMIGWPHAPSPAAQTFLDVALPQLPSLTRDGKIQVDEIRAAKPDLILDYGSIAPRYVERAKRLQEETGIPVLLLDGKLERVPEVYRLLGPVLDTETTANDLADDAAKLIGTIRQAPPPTPPIRVYYARSGDGLTTATSSSSLADVIRLVGAANVADATGNADGLVTVSLEQIAGWNPDVIVTNSSEFWDKRRAPEWAGIPAMAQGKVYLSPALPWGWIDEPPSVNRLLGPLWLSRALAHGTEDLRPAAAAFYLHFYRIKLNQRQLEELLP
jgi:iron complex transport system substrate-binding protein